MALARTIALVTMYMNRFVPSTTSRATMRPTTMPVKRSARKPWLLQMGPVKINPFTDAPMKTRSTTTLKLRMMTARAQLFWNVVKVKCRFW